MKFKILKKEKGYEVWYLNEFDIRGFRWSKVIWDEEAYRHFKDNNFTDTVEEARQKAAEFKEKFEKDHGVFVESFTL